MSNIRHVEKVFNNNSVHNTWEHYNVLVQVGVATFKTKPDIYYNKLCLGVDT